METLSTLWYYITLFLREITSTIAEFLPTIALFTQAIVFLYGIRVWRYKKRETFYSEQCYSFFKDVRVFEEKWKEAIDHINAVANTKPYTLTDHLRTKRFSQYLLTDKERKEREERKERQKYETEKWMNLDGYLKEGPLWDIFKHPYLYVLETDTDSIEKIEKVKKIHEDIIERFNRSPILGKRPEEYPKKKEKKAFNALRELKKCLAKYVRYERDATENHSFLSKVKKIIKPRSK